MNDERAQFWMYCKRVAGAARARAKAANLPYDIDAHFVDGLLVDQRWRCALSRIPLVPPYRAVEPFGPSLDRIVPALGYVKGNVRVVCTIVNFAMNKWGADALQKLLDGCRTLGERDIGVADKTHR